MYACIYIYVLFDYRSKQKSVKQSAWDKFLLSVRARLTVAQVVEGVRADAALTFDFIFLLVMAG
jgi:hypothetical protein